MKLDGIPPGVKSELFRQHRSPPPPPDENANSSKSVTKKCCTIPTGIDNNHNNKCCQDLNHFDDDCHREDDKQQQQQHRQRAVASTRTNSGITTPPLHHDDEEEDPHRPPVSVVVVRGMMPPLPYSSSSSTAAAGGLAGPAVVTFSDHACATHWEAAPVATTSRRNNSHCLLTPNGYNGSWPKAGSEATTTTSSSSSSCPPFSSPSSASFRLQPRASLPVAVTRLTACTRSTASAATAASRSLVAESNVPPTATATGGCRGRKRTAVGMSHCWGNTTTTAHFPGVSTTSATCGSSRSVRAGAPMTTTVIDSQPQLHYQQPMEVETETNGISLTKSSSYANTNNSVDDYPELDLDRGLSCSDYNTDVAIDTTTPNATNGCSGSGAASLEPKSPHVVLDSALFTLQGLSLCSPRAPSSPAAFPQDHTNNNNNSLIMLNTPNSSSSIKRPRGSSFSVYSNFSPAGSLPSASSTARPCNTTTTTTTMCTSARSSPRVVPLTVIMTDTTTSSTPSSNGGGRQHHPMSNTLFPPTTTTTTNGSGSNNSDLKTPPRLCGVRPPLITGAKHTRANVDKHQQLLLPPQQPQLLHPQQQQRGLLDVRSGGAAATVSFESPLSMKSPMASAASAAVAATTTSTANGMLDCSTGSSSVVTTPLPRVSLTPRSSSNGSSSNNNTFRDNTRMPVFPSPASMDGYEDDDYDDYGYGDDDDGDEHDVGLPKFCLDSSSPLIAPCSSNKNNKDPSPMILLSHADGHQEQGRSLLQKRPSPRLERDVIPPPAMKYPKAFVAAATGYQHFGSSNSLALSADGSQDQQGSSSQFPLPMMLSSLSSPMEDTVAAVATTTTKTLPRLHPSPKSFLPFPNWLHPHQNSSRSHHVCNMPIIGDIVESPGTPLSPDSPSNGGGSLSTPPQSNCGKSQQQPVFGADENDDDDLEADHRNRSFHSSQSLLPGPSSLLATNRLLVQSMSQSNPRYYHNNNNNDAVNGMMMMDSGSLSDSDDGVDANTIDDDDSYDTDEPFLLASPKQIAEERLLAKRARLRREWIGDSNHPTNSNNNKTTSTEHCAGVVMGRRLSLSSATESNTSLFGMDIPHDEPNHHYNYNNSASSTNNNSSSNRLFNPNSISATSFPSQYSEDSVVEGNNHHHLTYNNCSSWNSKSNDSGDNMMIMSRLRSENSLGSLGLSLEIIAANTTTATCVNSLFTSDTTPSTTAAAGRVVTSTTTPAAEARDLVTPPLLVTNSTISELSPPPFAPKQNPMLLFAETASSSVCCRPSSSQCFDLSHVQVEASTASSGGAMDTVLYDGGVDDDDDDNKDDQRDAMEDDEPPYA